MRKMGDHCCLRGNTYKWAIIGEYDIFWEIDFALFEQIVFLQVSSIQKSAASLLDNL